MISERPGDIAGISIEQSLGSIGAGFSPVDQLPQRRNNAFHDLPDDGEDIRGDVREDVWGG